MNDFLCGLACMVLDCMLTCRLSSYYYFLFAQLSEVGTRFFILVALSLFALFGYLAILGFCAIAFSRFRFCFSLCPPMLTTLLKNTWPAV